MRTIPLIAASLLPVAAAAQQPVLEIEPGFHHLGDSRVETWADVPADPEGTELSWTFESATNSGEWLLEITHQDIDNTWILRLNDTVIRRMTPEKRRVVSHVVLPPGVVKAGTNQLTLRPTKSTDDIIAGGVRLHRATLREVLRLQPVMVTIRDPADRALPARLTVVDSDRQMAQLYYGERLLAAVRPGITYTADGRATFELPPGDYTLWASRGSEWGVARAAVRIADAAPGQAPFGPIELTIAREVDTTGYVAADTHVHTLTHSGHGDASVEERMVTLAGEGVELAVATDHNHNTDYRPAQQRMSLGEYFTPVIGNEVTTKVGHFNAFPMNSAEVPDHELEHWLPLVLDMRDKGAKVVILNHPRWPQIPTGPFGVFRLDRFSGEIPDRAAVPFDAMELVNGGTLQNDPMYLFVDWFALLNHGETVTAVGSSDSHTVALPVGHGRTYVRSSTDDAASIDIDEACQSFRAGHTTVSFGIYCEISVGDGFGLGDIVPVADRLASVELRVAAPSWVRPTLARLFVNGIQVASGDLSPAANQSVDEKMSFAFTTPPHDGHLVCVITGDPVRDPFWQTSRNYTLAATNPIYLDVDGDGNYSHPRATAQQIVGDTGDNPVALHAALAEVDAAVMIEALSIVHAALDQGPGDDAAIRRIRAQLETIAGPQRSSSAVARYLNALLEPREAGR